MTDRIQQEQQGVLIYDADCRLCVTAKAGIERWGKDGPQQTVRFLAYQSEEATHHLGAEYRAGRPDAAFLIKSDGTIQRGLEAFLPLLPGLPGGRWMLMLVRNPMFKPLARLAYRVIARNRYRWFGTAARLR